MAEQDIADKIAAFLAAHHVVALASVDDAGAPHAASLMYANDDFTLFWVSDPKSRHSRHIDAGRAVAATIAPDYVDFKDIRGLQITGLAGRVEGLAATAKAMTLLAKKFPFFNQFLEGPGDLIKRLKDAAVYRLDCRTITLIDNTVAFGHKDVLEIAP